MSPSAEMLMAICKRTLDPRARFIAVHAGHDSTIALRARTVAGTVIVKAHRSPDRHHREVHAYQHWTTALGDCAPRLIAVCDDPLAIIVTAFPGRMLAETTLSPPHEASAHRQAGELLHRLHHATPHQAELTMTLTIAERGEHWLHQAKAFMPTSRQAEIRAHLRALARLPPIPAVPCHLDFMPRNMILQPDRRLAVIDFEHSRYDLAARDLVRLADRIWPTRPDLEKAFLDGYGQLTDLDRQVIEHCTHLDRLTLAVRTHQREQG
ncbi:aminoglycoside phosphotransferase family protein [Micromonospora sp. NPDC085948]|uniref:aminoglycoside phosphotransferase family protein n=1 Tax=Micromonospora sp. NPDC085948 TaxID=3155293 RepID=UPI003444459C